MNGMTTIALIGIIIIIMLVSVVGQTQAALYRVTPPCKNPVIAEWKPLYPSLGALVANQPDSYQPIYRCVKENS